MVMKCSKFVETRVRDPVPLKIRHVLIMLNLLWAQLPHAGVVWKYALESILSVRVTSRLIDPRYGVRGTAKELISIAPAYCLKEPIELGRRREVPWAQIHYAHQSEII
ncbi:hypothetical protein TNCV_1268651 [Trichonephila clavipes]|nr:hypothetical protein TNCV_1268651 [Trichonephila clavipes]